MPRDESQGQVGQTRLTDGEQERWRELQEVPVGDLSDQEITSKIKLSVKRRYSGEWVLMFEYGGQNGRVADAIAVNTVASRNYKIVGFEFKASRSDWLRELKDPEKADHFVRICDEWYVVAPKGIVQESELPEGWGYLEMKPNSEKLYKIQDSELTDYQQGDPDRAFWIRFLKKTVGNDSNFSQSDLKEARARGYDEAKAEYQKKSNPDVNIDRLRDKAESWDALQSRFSVLPWSRLSDDQLDTLELAFQLAKIVEDGRYSGLLNELERLEYDIERHYEGALESTEQLADGIDTLHERIEDGKLPEEVDADVQ